jgi:hypothetical protein
MMREWRLILPAVAVPAGGSPPPHRRVSEVAKVFFLDLVFLPEGTGITGYREISEIPPIYRTNFFEQILNSKYFTLKEIKFVSILLCSSS